LSTPTRLEESLNAATAAFSPKGDLLAILQKGTIVVHDLQPANGIQSICRTVNRNLTINEWADYVGPAAYQTPCPELLKPR
jgi:hypothetical protein